MPEIDFLEPQPNQCILTAHIAALSRAGRETGVINGNQLTASSPADMIVNAAAGRIKIAGAPVDVEADTVELSAAHETLPRIDIIYRDADGALQVDAGTPASIEDPKELSDWKSYTSPQPSCDVPPGVILGAVFVSAGATAITSGYIWMFAGGVGDVSTAIATPGVDSKVASEKAVRDGLDTKISLALATAANNFLVASGPGAFVEKTLAEIETLLGLGTAAYTALTDYAVAAKGVTNGDTHDHQSGRGAAIAASATVFSNTAKILARKTESGGVGEECSLSEVLDFIGSAARGDILYRGVSAWARLGKGTSGQVLVQGASDPAWGMPKLDDLGAPDDNTDLDASTTKHGLMMKFPDTKQVLLGNKTWLTRVFGPAAFVFGDGSLVITDQEIGVGPFPAACKITSASIREQALISSSATVTLHIHDRDAAIGDAVDTFSLASATNYNETGLSHTVAAGKWVTIKVASITAAKQLSIGLTFEAT